MSPLLTSHEAAAKKPPKAGSIDTALVRRAVVALETLATHAGTFLAIIQQIKVEDDQREEVEWT